MQNGLDAQKQKKRLDELEQENEQLRRGYMSLSRRLIGLRMLQHIAQDLVAERDVDNLLQRILRSTINAVEGTAGAVILLDPVNEELVFSVIEGGGGEALQGRRIAMDQGIAGWTVRRNESLIINDVSQDERYREDVSSKVSFEVHSLLCAPLVTKGVVIGAVQVLNKAHGARFDDDDLDLMTTFAAQSATAIENARLYQDLKRERDRILDVEEEIRRRLARDLHDGPAQLLAAIIVNIEFVRKLLVFEPDKVRSELDSLAPLAQKALRQVRTLLFDLRPVILETQGLAPALESYVLRQQETEGLNYHLHVEGFSGRLLARAERAIFGIVQEAVGNVKKHAQADNLWIMVEQRGEDLHVEIRDDGRGFDVKRMGVRYDESGSLGMLNMRERAAAIGGRLSIRSQPGSGTTIGLSASLGRLRQTEF